MPTRSIPSKWTWPLSAGIRPVTRLKSVVFPAPFGPMMALSLPLSSSRSTSSTATSPPKRRVKPWMRSEAPAHRLLRGDPGGRRARLFIAALAVDKRRRQLLNATDDAARREHHAQDDDDPDGEKVMLPDRGHDLAEYYERRRSDDRPEGGARAANDRPHNRPAGYVRE